MLICMRTTLNLDDNLVREAKRIAAEKGLTLTAVIQDSLRAIVAAHKPKKTVAIPTFLGDGVFLGVDLNSNSNLLDIMDGIHGRP